MAQLTLGLITETEYYSEDFIVTNANVEAFKAIQNPHLWPDKRLLVIGDEGSGKTHLTEIFKSLHPTTSHVVDNIDKLVEEDLFHTINKATNDGTFLLLTASKFIRYELADLRSRINVTHKILLKNPDDTLLRIILSKRFSDKQIRVKDEVLDYILIHHDRSYIAIKKLVDDLDQLSLSAKRNITIPLVKLYTQSSSRIGL